MLSTKEIADYVHGQARTPEKQQFTFGEVKKVGDALTMHWHAVTHITDDEPRPAGKIALAVKANKAKAIISRLRIADLRESPTAGRNILLILLFVVIFAVMFVLESRHAPANPTHAYPRSASTAVR